MKRICKASVVYYRGLCGQGLKALFPQITVMGELQGQRLMITAVELGGEIVPHKGKSRKGLSQDVRKGLSQGMRKEPSWYMKKGYHRV